MPFRHRTARQCGALFSPTAIIEANTFAVKSASNGRAISVTAVVGYNM